MKNLTQQLTPRYFMASVIYSLVTMGIVTAGPPAHQKPQPAPPSLLTGCTPGAAQTDLDVNNVRARMLTGGDFWWDYSNSSRGQYEVPKGGGIMPIYAGALWIGGYDGANLLLAGQEYRSTGNDWWPGPLNNIGVNPGIAAEVCQAYDKHYKITASEVANFIGGAAATPAITGWPAHGNTSIGEDQYLAPFYDKNGDGVYNPGDGDYPGFDMVGAGCTESQCVPVDHLFGDETLWWVINDRGNIHTATNGASMGLEVHCQAFGFFTDDEINNMTFNSYRIYNRSPFAIDSTFIGIWSDVEIGCATDDYVGCDVARGLGYCYNGTNNDVACSGELGYGLNPPAVGIDFFRGPVATPNDGVDNDRDCKIDNLDPCEQAIMSHFVYFTNGAPPGYGDPKDAKEYYNYLSGSWANGNHLLYGGSGFGTLTGATNIPCDYCFPGKTDHTYEWGTGGNCSTPATAQADWSEVTAGQTPNDRRLVESAGPFKMLPGAVNVVTAGVVWARAAGGNIASLNLLQSVDDKAQKLFDNCFQVLNGPDAPDLTIQELDKKLIIYLTNKSTSNNYNETYQEYDPSISLFDSAGIAVPCIDTTYNFEGYKVFQVKDATVSANDLADVSKARLVAQCDVKNGVSNIINYIFDQTLGSSIPALQVTGTDKGIFHSLEITNDLFAQGDPKIVNHRTYFFMAVTYGYNNYKPYKQDGVINWADNKCSPNTATGSMPAGITAAMDGQKKSYKQGRRNIKNYSAIPHISTPYANGTEMHGSYGAGPMVTRIEGNGNGGMELELTPASTSAILSASDSRMKTPQYTLDHGPINVSVVDPLNVPDGNNFTLKLDTMPVIQYNSLLGGFLAGDTVTGSGSGAKGIVINSYVATPVTTGAIYIRPLSGTFAVNDTVTGTKNGDLHATAKKIPTTIDYAAWTLTNNTQVETINSANMIKGLNEQLILKWGLAISIFQTGDPGSAIVASNNGLISSSITFADASKKWLTGLKNVDAKSYSHWIRSGKTSSTDDFLNCYVGIDDNQYYEGVVDGTWAPYRLVAPTATTFDHTLYYTGPGFQKLIMPKTQIKDLSSVDVVFTSDKSKWTRCPVIEMCEDSLYADSSYLHTNGITSRARKFDIRRAPSVDKNGNPDGTTNTWGPPGVPSTGMSWFPGYAINLETGERLNMAFGENSALVKQHGNDMKWNPTANTTSTDSLPWDSQGQTGSPVFGGQHYIYVFGHIKDNDSVGSPTPNDFINMPRYDAGKFMDSILHSSSGLPSNTNKGEIYRDALWVNIPLLTAGHSLLETDVTVRLRVSKSYKFGYSPATIQDGTKIIYTDTASVAWGQNKNLPMYTFTTDGIATHTSQSDRAASAMDLINIVPNPYYAYSKYETNSLDNRVKITNLPEVCTISIYNLGGTLIRRMTQGMTQYETTYQAGPKSEDATIAWHDGSMDWDLKNTIGTPIASGVYIIHVEVPGVGEKTLKWFGVLRPIDLQSY